MEQTIRNRDKEDRKVQTPPQEDSRRGRRRGVEFQRSGSQRSFMVTRPSKLREESCRKELFETSTVGIIAAVMPSNPTCDKCLLAGRDGFSPDAIMSSDWNRKMTLSRK